MYDTPAPLYRKHGRVASRITLPFGKPLRTFYDLHIFCLSISALALSGYTCFRLLLTYFWLLIFPPRLYPATLVSALRFQHSFYTLFGFLVLSHSKLTYIANTSQLFCFDFCFSLFFDYFSVTFLSSALILSRVLNPLLWLWKLYLCEKCS